MVTVTDLVVGPPAPVQVSVKVVSEESAVLVVVPLKGCFPLQPPVAVHEVAF
jgi:hypothetical protein